MDATEILFALVMWGLRLAWSRLVDLGSIDSGSNPGGPTTPVVHLNFFSFLNFFRPLFLSLNNMPRMRQPEKLQRWNQANSNWKCSALPLPRLRLQVFLNGRGLSVAGGEGFDPAP